MVKALLIGVALVCADEVALAGPNAGGTIIVHNPRLAYPGHGQSACGLGQEPASCESAITEIDGGDNAFVVWKVYAAFIPCSAPRLKGVSWGIHYDPAVIIVDDGACDGWVAEPQDMPGPGWPGTDTGDTVVFTDTQTTTLVELYWFAGYAYNGVPSIFALRDHPDPSYGGRFMDDAAPQPDFDPIAGYGTLGFNQPGRVWCPDENLFGACCVGEICTLTCESGCQGQWMGPFTTCDPNPCFFEPGACCTGEECITLTPDGCDRIGGTYMGDGTTCDPNPCPVTPVQNQSWGRIKTRYG